MSNERRVGRTNRAFRQSRPNSGHRTTVNRLTDFVSESISQWPMEDVEPRRQMKTNRAEIEGIPTRKWRNGDGRIECCRSLLITNSVSAAIEPALHTRSSGSSSGREEERLPSSAVVSGSDTDCASAQQAAFEIQRRLGNQAEPCVSACLPHLPSSIALLYFIFRRMRRDAFPAEQPSNCRRRGRAGENF